MIRLANRTKQIAGRFPGASLLLAAMAFVLWFAPGLSSWCEWNRSLPWQAWRWLTGHFCHWSAEHLTWDVAAFLFLGAWCERHSRRQFLTCIFAAAVAICLATVLLLPGIQSYRGLSGIDSALFGWLSVGLLRSALDRKDRRMVGVVLLFLIAFTAKVAFECLTASTWFVSAAQGGFVPVPLAHAAGVVAGIGSNLFSSRSQVRRALVNPRLAA
jgi:rhomboid family GlyGly-CTERM serine protease